MSAPFAKRRKLSSALEVQVGPNSNSSSANVVETARRDKESSSEHRNGRFVFHNPQVKQAKSSRSSFAEPASASGLYKSSFFKIQMDDLLTELRPNYEKHLSNMQEVLQNLKRAIERIPDRPPKPISEAEAELRSQNAIIVPFPDPRPTKDTKYTVTYSQPSNINVVGSFTLRTGVKSTDYYTIDLVATMPSILFQEKDYVNYRYFHKRAYYIACIAAGLQSADLELQISFGQQDGDSLRPIVMLEPAASGAEGNRCSKYRVRILTAIDDTVFPAKRTLPMKNNLRRQALAASADDDSMNSTPFYNAALRSEVTVALYHKYLYLATMKSDSFRDACILGRTWLRQRGFHTSIQHGGFGGFEWAAVMALLFDGGGPNGKPTLLQSYSSYQLFKATIQFLAGRNLMEPLALFATGITFPRGGPTLYDGRRELNILYKMTASSYAVLKHEAAITLRMLNESREDNFERVFLLKVDEPMLRYDRIISLPFDYGLDILKAIKFQSDIYEILAKALGNRVKLISLSSRVLKPWSVGARAAQDRSSKVLHVGLILDSENVSRIVDHGPSAEEKKEAAAFRSFWGDKAELRRFKDGSILESVVWSDEPSGPSIVHQISTYVLHRHFNIAEKGITFTGDEFDERLRGVGNGVVSYNSSSFERIMTAFNSLEQSFQTMNEVPLTVRQLLPTSPLLRYSALRVPNLRGFATDPVDVVLRFESSARWPDDLTAIQMTKLAFLIKIGDFLESSKVASSCRVGLENETSKFLNNAFLAFVHESGVVFHLRIYHDREQTLLERELKTKSMVAQSKEEIAYALYMHKRAFIQGPRLSQAVRNLCTRLPLLSPTIRLVKHWFNSHLLSGHFSEEFIELLTARIFIHSFPWETPSSVMAGFLRTVHFLTRWDWQQQPLEVDLGGGLNDATLDVIQTRFSAWRTIDPAMNNVAIFAASDIDTEGVTWTQYAMPSKVVAARLSSLAKAAMKLVRNKGCDIELSELFQTSLAPYDFVFYLNPKITRDRSAEAIQFKNLAEHSVSGKFPTSPVVASFVRELEACFNNSLLLFYDSDSKDVISGLWNPQVLKSRGWSLKMAYCTCPTYLCRPEHGQKDEVTINQAAILNQICSLGKGIIDRIEMRDNNGQN